jgi:hypothetical protein
MKLEMRQKLARGPFEEKIRKVSQLIRLVKRFPKRQKNTSQSTLQNSDGKP